MEIKAGSSEKRSLLLAGTRLTGDKPHIGTFYGWIHQIIKASEVMDVCVIIADYQSLDTIYHNKKYSSVSSNLKKTLHKLLPSSVPIILESDIPSLPALSLITTRLITKSFLNRIAPFRKLRKEGKDITLNTMLYPSFMIADILSIGATHIFNKPEGRFQHLDVINDVLNKGYLYFDWPKVKLKAYEKRKIDIPSIDGSGPMKRNRMEAGVIEIVDATPKSIREELSKSKVPDLDEDPSSRRSSCKVIKEIWKAVGKERSPKQCNELDYPCKECVNFLSENIFSDISYKNTGSCGGISEIDVIEKAEQRIKQLIDLAMHKNLLEDSLRQE